MTSTSARKYSFGDSLINDEGRVILPELEHAKKISYQEGYDTGFAKAKSELEADVEVILQKININLCQLTEKQHEAYSYVSGSTFTLLLEITKKLFPSMLESKAEEEITKFVEDVLSSIDTNTQIIFHVHKNLVEPIRKKTDKLQINNDKMSVKVVEDKELNRFDCTVEWDDGGIEHFPLRIVNEVEKTLLGMLENVPVPEISQKEEVEKAQEEHSSEEKIAGEDNV